LLILSSSFSHTNTKEKENGRKIDKQDKVEKGVKKYKTKRKANRNTAQIKYILFGVSFTFPCLVFFPSSSLAAGAKRNNQIRQYIFLWDLVFCYVWQRQPGPKEEEGREIKERQREREQK